MQGRPTRFGAAVGHHVGGGRTVLERGFLAARRRIEFRVLSSSSFTISCFPHLSKSELVKREDNGPVPLTEGRL